MEYRADLFPLFSQLANSERPDPLLLEKTRSYENFSAEERVGEGMDWGNKVGREEW